MSVTPWRTIETDQSPFVEMFVLVGFAGAAGLVNAVVLSSATLSANIGLFSSSRMVYGLATGHQAPRQFARLTRTSVPGAALMLSCVVVLIGGVLAGTLEDAFQVVTTVSAILFVFVWSIILVSYLVTGDVAQNCMPLRRTSCAVEYGCR